MEKLFSLRGMVFIAAFLVLAFTAMQIKTFEMHGSNGKYFSMVDFMGPIAGAFLGILGVAVIGAAKLINAVFMPPGLVPGDWVKLAIDLARLTPLMFAAWYFGRNGIRGMQDKAGIIIPIAAMAAFWLHPLSMQWAHVDLWLFSLDLPVAAYALFWLVPIAVKFMPDKLFLRSLGTTFMQHAVGSVIFIYTIPTSPEMWVVLLPFVAIERTLLALGVTASHMIFTNALNALDSVWNVTRYINLEKQYVLTLD